MSFISAIRQRSGLILSVVALSLVLFIVQGALNDESGLISRMLGREPVVGEINGSKVTLKEYDEEVKRLEQDFQIQNDRGPSEAERQQIRDQAWNTFIFQKLYKPQAEELGMSISKEEIFDMIQGNNIHPAIRQAFTNPETQQFDKARIKQFLGNLEKLEPRQQYAWASFVSKLPDDRMRTKYEALLTKTEYVTRAQAAFEYRNSLTKANVQYLFVNYNTIPDSTVKVSDEELAAFLKENQYRYKTQENRAIDYVQFLLTPSSKDSAFTREELARLKTEFTTTTDDTVFAAANSDSPSKLQTLTVNDLPADLASMAGILTAGNVYGPYLNGSTYTLYKVVSVAPEGAYSAKASHILFKVDKGAADTAKANAKKKAGEILAKIKGGADFAEMARMYGSDGTKDQGGDLGWFDETRMVKPFADAVFKFQGTGLLPNLVETDFGYHIVKVTGAKTNLKYKVVTVQKNITASDETSNEIYAKATAFKQEANDAASFEAAAKKFNLNKVTTPNVFKSGAGFNDIQDARTVIYWSYNDKTNVGDVSTVFELPDRYLIAVLTKATEEGPAKVEDVRDALTAEVRKQKKAADIIAKLGTGSYEEMQKKVPGAIVNTTNDLLLSASAFMDVGYDPEAVGRAFGQKAGVAGKPFKGESGVVALKVLQLTDAPAVDAKTDLSSYKAQIEQRNSGRTQYYIGEALKEVGKVKDERVKVMY